MGNCLNAANDDFTDIAKSKFSLLAWVNSDEGFSPSQKSLLIRGGCNGEFRIIQDIFLPTDQNVLDCIHSFVMRVFFSRELFKDMCELGVYVPDVQI